MGAIIFRGQTLFDIASQWQPTLMIFSGYVAIAILGVAIGLVCWGWLRDRVYLYFSFYLSAILAVGFFAGLFFNFDNFTDQDRAFLRISIFVVSIVNIAHFFFVRELVAPQKNMPKLYRAMVVTLSLLMLTEVIALFFPTSLLWNARGQILAVYTIINVIVAVKSVVIFPYVRWYAAGIVIFLASNTPLILANAGMLESLNAVTASIPFLGVFAETLLFLIGLVDRLRYEHSQSLQSIRLKMLGTTAAEIFHEIATPLTIMMNNGIMVKDRSEEIPNKELREKLFSFGLGIEEHGMRIKANIERFRMLASYQDMSAPQESILLIDVLSSVNEMSKGKLIKRRSHLEIEDRTSGQVQIRGNKFELEQVFFNLIANAADAVASLDDRWIKLSIELKGKFVECRVIDSGKGISKELVENLFSPFFTTKGKGEGMGLGLSICKKFVDNHKGKIYFDQESPKTTFVVLLPVESILPPVGKSADLK